MKDYYIILGVNRGATRESIKAAYRQLARETHPDRKIFASENEKALLSRQMAKLNEAFAVLYDVKHRREYDEQLRIRGALLKKPPAAKRDTNINNSSSADQPNRTRQRRDLGSNLVSEFSNHLRTTLLANRDNFAWRQRDLEGFDWALEATSWSFRLWVSVRGFTSVDAAIARKFIRYAEAITAHHKSYLRKTTFLFLLPFQQLEEWDSVSAQCRQFVAVEKTAKSPSSPRGIVLLDLQHGRTLRFDAQIRGKQFASLLEQIGTPS